MDSDELPIRQRIKGYKKFFKRYEYYLSSLIDYSTIQSIDYHLGPIFSYVLSFLVISHCPPPCTIQTINSSHHQAALSHHHLSLNLTGFFKETTACNLSILIHRPSYIIILSPIIHNPSPVTRNPSSIIHHPSPITHYPSTNIRHHPSPITHHQSPIPISNYLSFIMITNHSSPITHLQ